MSDRERQRAGGAAVQRRATVEDWGRGRNGVAVRTQLRQNAAFKAQMLSGGSAVQRKEYRKRGEADPNAHLKKELRVSNIEDPATVCAILRFVWPDQNISEADCADSGFKQLAVQAVNMIVESSNFLDVTPRPAVPTPGWVLDQIKGVVTRATGDTDIYSLSLHRIRGTLRAGALFSRGARESGAFTDQRGLGY